MLGKVTSLSENIVEVTIENGLSEVKNLLNYHVIFEESNLKIVGEIKEIDSKFIKVNLLGEIRNGVFVAGIVKKPSIDSQCRIIQKAELDIIIGNSDATEVKKIYMGKMPLYDNYPVSVNVNDFFAYHFSVFGNTGSGKSYSVARILQNAFYNKNAIPKNARIFIFDAYGEYKDAFSRLKDVSLDLNFKSYTTDLNFPDTDILQLPVWFLGVDDLALLLGADNHIQLPIIEKALKLVSIFARNDDNVIQYKNDIIARALLDILYSGNPASQTRDHLLAILTAFNTKDLNLETKVSQPGYIRTLGQCLLIDKDGKLHEMQLVTEFISQFVKEGLVLNFPDGTYPYTLEHLKEAFDFALISEGVLNSDKVYDYANMLKVRLNSLVSGDAHRYLEYPEFITKEAYIKKLLVTDDGKTAQIVNFNIEYVDDRLAKVITKIYSKLLYDYVSSLQDKASFPVHIILEEAHRYVQNDNDQFLLGYNIFDRITKEGRKYGILLGLISQRPSELSETALSQCSNFLIFKMVHPQDTMFIKNMVPNITNEIVEKLKTLQPGTCIAFGSAFKIPTIIHFDFPDPRPSSHNANIGEEWYK